MRTKLLHNSGGARRGALLAIAALLAALSLVIALGGGEAPAQLSSATSQLDQVNARQGDLQAEIEQQNDQINSLIAEEADLRAQEAAVADQLAAKQAELDEATQELHEAREYLEQVKAQLEDAKAALRKMLVQMYKSNPPDMVDVVLESTTWTDAIAQAEYLDQINAHQDAVISRVTELRAEVEATVERLTDARARIEAARDEIAARRDELASARADLESQHAELVAAKQERQQTLSQLQDREQHLQNEIAQSAPPPDAGSATAPAAPPPSGSTATLAADGSAVAPADAPEAVKGAIAAANSIKDAPYAWGGGHGSFESSGYDCSGSVSFALHGGGLLSTPLDSGGFMSYGDPGPGNWITVYANSGHAYAVIAGLRWDTSGDSGSSGPSWYTSMRSSAGYVARHPPGL
jgi:peptidoglycan hydrolase CwlO-like protein